jgi:hypothetical protein
VKHLLVLSLALFTLLTGCASVRWAALDDGTLQDPSGSELGFLENTTSSAILFEDFNDDQLAEGVRVCESVQIEEGGLRLLGEGKWVNVRLPKEATRIVACYRLEAKTGRIGMTTYLAEGHTEIFSDVLGSWAQNMDRLTPYRRVTGPDYGSREGSNWVVHEMRIDRNRVQFYADGRRFGSVRLVRSNGFRAFSIVAESEGHGTLDWVLAI